jgi:hypothetical protein
MTSPSAGQIAAVHRPDRAGDPAAGRATAGTPPRWPRRPARRSPGGAGVHSPPCRFPTGLGPSGMHLGLDPAGGDGVDANGLGSQLAGQGPGQPLDRRLGGRIGHHARAPALGRGRGHEAPSTRRASSGFRSCRPRVPGPWRHDRRAEHARRSVCLGQASRQDQFAARRGRRRPGRPPPWRRSKSGRRSRRRRSSTGAKALCPSPGRSAIVASRRVSSRPVAITRPPHGDQLGGRAAQARRGAGDQDCPSRPGRRGRRSCGDHLGAGQGSKLHQSRAPG